ncbi:hypothetical protein D5039_04950 [Verminephrobacter aporrectodeae subsp. tuberculatae]|uniref:Uncharacterized protein n=1 Tax=Verminephrobacter aporrectodeae subsp. tuberculatae TaxID=1110392 RepID=A0ABT3KQF3_9BURK|nr:hypothetical protein [Verminephrobacter aporrectodeae]MCW5320552.1 hypothetical protein [Verminephrobacter aporrectodeae subsp. tuberculatae]
MATPIEQTTQAYSLQLPHPSNNLDDDILRLREALQGIDTALQGLATGLARAATNENMVAGMSTLSTAVNGKQATLVSGNNIKTINANSLLGTGDLLLMPKRFSVTRIQTNTQAQIFQGYEFTASLDLTLPISPTDGDWVLVIDRSNTTTARLIGNVEGGTNFEINVKNAAFFVIYKTTCWRAIVS